MKVELINSVGLWPKLDFVPLHRAVWQISVPVGSRQKSNILGQYLTNSLKDLLILWVLFLWACKSIWNSFSQPFLACDPLNKPVSVCYWLHVSPGCHQFNHSVLFFILIWEAQKREKNIKTREKGRINIILCSRNGFFLLWEPLIETIMGHWNALNFNTSLTLGYRTGFC